MNLHVGSGVRLLITSSDGAEACGQLLLSGFLTAEFDVVAQAFSHVPSLVEYEKGWAAAVLTR
jgi:hypothetical protein